MSDGLVLEMLKSLRIGLGLGLKVGRKAVEPGSKSSVSKKGVAQR